MGRGYSLRGIRRCNGVDLIWGAGGYMVGVTCFVIGGRGWYTSWGKWARW
jgi:hypothetical protein